MKKIILPIYIACCFSGVQAQQSINIDISFNYVICHIGSETDDIFNLDGKGDEVYLFGAAFILNDNGDIIRKQFCQTPVYGSARGFAGRVNAGSCVDGNGSNAGGLKAGDRYDMNLHVIKMTIYPNEYLYFIPSIWESDNNPVTFNNYITALENLSFIKRHKMLDLCKLNTTNYGGIQLSVVGDDIVSGIISPITLNGSVAGDRPVGLQAINFSLNRECKFYFREEAIAVSWNNLVEISKNNYGIGIGKYGIGSGADERALSHWSDADLATYSLSSTVELYANYPPPPAPAPKPDISSNTNIKPTIALKNVPLKNISLANTNMAVVGVWKGTQTNDYGLYPQQIGFELTANGEYFIKDINGVVAAKGTYTFSRNVISGNYKSFSSGEYFSFTAVYDPASQKITGSLGSGSATAGQGKWVVSK